jgi:hypothetical protein
MVSVPIVFVNRCSLRDIFFPPRCTASTAGGTLQIAGGHTGKTLLTMVSSLFYRELCISQPIDYSPRISSGISD